MSDSIDLGPGSISEFWAIPATDWEIVNKRVSVILDPSKGPAEIQNKLKALSNYENLVAVSKAWKKSTFDGLVDLASSLHDFSTTTVESYLSVLKMIIDQFVDGDKSMKERFDNTVDGFVSSSINYSSSAAALSPLIREFDTQMTQADVGGSGGDDPIWNAFSFNAGNAFDIIESRFNSLTNDLNDMKQNVNEKLKSDDRVVVQFVDLPNAQTKWKTVSDLSQGFVANAPAQRHFQNGDW